MNKRFTLENGLQLRNSSPEEVQKIQVGLLREHCRQAGRGRYYGRLFADCGFQPEDITRVDDLLKLPLTARADIEPDPAAFQAVADEKIVDIPMTSGTTGVPLPVPYSRRDLERLAFNEQMNFYSLGADSRSRFLLCVTLDRCFVAGLAYYTGLVRLGASAIRSGPGHPAQQWEIAGRLKPDGIVGVPSFLLKMGLWGRENGVLQNADIRRIVAIGEPVRRADLSLTPLGKDLEDVWGAKVFSNYGATELQGAFADCTAAAGGHVHPELNLVEIVNDSGEVQPSGVAGEIVVTTLGVEGMPLIRFRTGDIARLHTGRCGCGWQTPRLGPIEGRLSQRLKVKGTTIYPEMIFQTLQNIAAVEAVYVEVDAEYDLSDRVTVVIGGDGVASQMNDITSRLQARLRVIPEIVVHDKKEMLVKMEKAGGRKQKRFFDLRGEKRT